MSLHARATHDPTVYPVEEKMGEESLQRFIVEMLRPLVAQWLASRRVQAFTGADLFVYFRQHDVTKRVAPDVFVLPGVRPGMRLKSWKTWERGIVPSFALEVVSSDVDKDYIDAPRLYAELGVKELIVFDPDYESDRGRFRFQVFRHVGKRGLVRVETTSEEAVESRVLGCFVRSCGVGEETRLRLATDAGGSMLVPTAEERERAEKERERTARIAAEAEVARLRALLRERASKRRS